MRRPPLTALIAVVLISATGVGSPALAQGKEIPVNKIQVRITEPIDGDFIFGKGRIAAEVEAPEELGSIRVEFSVGGKLIFIDREPPYEAFHDFGEDPRSWVIEAVAVSEGGLRDHHAVVTRKLTINYHEVVDRVVVTASVVDKDRTFVSGLEKDDFQLYEDNVLQTIVDFSIETRPIKMAILIDTSGSMLEELDEVQAAAQSFVRTLRETDQALIIDFDENVYLLQDLTDDHGLLNVAIKGTDAEGGTALYDAVYAAYRKFREIEGRKTIVLLTDGADTNSRFSYKKVIELTRTHDVVVYSIGLGATVLDIGIRSSLKQLADETGGRAFFPTSAVDLQEVYAQIAEDLRSQYYLAYTSSNKEVDGGWRKIKLESTVKGVKIKTRRGYYAVKN